MKSVIINANKEFIFDKWFYQKDKKILEEEAKFILIFKYIKYIEKLTYKASIGKN